MSALQEPTFATSVLDYDTLAAVLGFDAGRTPPDALEPSPRPWSCAAELIRIDEAIARFDLEQRLFRFPRHLACVRVVEGDLRVEGDLILGRQHALGVNALLVTGNLQVSGAIIDASSDADTLLLVGGHTRAQAIIGRHAQLLFEGDAEVADIVIGHHAEGLLSFAGDLQVPAVISVDALSQVRGESLSWSAACN